MVLHSHKRKRLGPVLAEEEGNHIVIGCFRGIPRIMLHFRSGNGSRGTSLCFVVKNVMDTLNVERIEAAHLLSTDVEEKFSRTGVLREEAGSVITRGGDTRGFNPYITEEITLRLDGDCHFSTRRETTDVVNAFGFDGEVSVTLVGLTEKTDFRLTSDVDILGTLGHEVNQGS
jgi:hypothetical protein